MKIAVVKNILEANQRIAEENRCRFDQQGLRVLNLMSSPGAGKTSLLEKTIQALKGEVRIGVIEGDIQSTFDAERIERTGIPAVQINTGGVCHLDSNMIQEALRSLKIQDLDLLFIENVGNLVCPAEFNLGEHFKVAVLSVAEGDDKPLKYPLLFKESQVLVVNKIDLLPYCECHLDLMIDRAKEINPQLAVFPLSCRTGEGLEKWTGWLRGEIVTGKWEGKQKIRA